MRRAFLAVGFIVILGLPGAAQQRRSGMPPALPPAAEVMVPADRVGRVAEWLKAVDRHEPGESDDAVAVVGGWSNAQLRGLWIDVSVLARLMRNPRMSRFVFKSEDGRTSTEVRYPPALLKQMAALSCAATGTLDRPDCVALNAPVSVDDALFLLATHVRAERQHTGEEHYVMRRAALLHAEVAMLQPHAEIEPFGASRPTVGPTTWRLEMADGRGLNAGMWAVHWDIARLALDQFPPDAMVRGWYRATAAWMQLREDHDTLHLDRARALFPDDPDLLFLSGCQRETYAAPALQAAGRSVALPTGLTVGIESERSELRQAEAFFRRVVALRPSMGEAHLRLGRVLALTGRHADAAAELKTALPLVDTDDLRYYAELFAGAEHEALRAYDEAQVAYERAAALFPLAQSPYVAMSELAHRRGDRIRAVDAIEKAFALPAAVDGARDDPWWRYHVAQARDADDLLEAVRAPFRLEARQ